MLALLGSCGQDLSESQVARSLPYQLPLITTPASRAKGSIAPAGAIVLGDASAPNTYKLLCSATLIAPGLVLTAAHCLSSRNGAPHDLEKFPLFFTTEKKVFYATDDEVVPIQSFAVHPGYTPATHTLSVLFRGAKTPQEEKLKRAIKEQCGTVGSDTIWSKFWWRWGDPSQLMLDQEEQWWACVHRSELVANWLQLEPPNLPQHDIAMATLEHEVADIEPARLPKTLGTDVDLAAKLTVAGYGTLSQERQRRPIDGVRQLGFVQIAAADAKHLALGSGLAQACFGDSGAGVFATDGDDPEVIGLMSCGEVMPLSGRCAGRMWLTRIAAYLPWISHISQNTPLL